MGRVESEVIPRLMGWVKVPTQTLPFGGIYAVAAANMFHGLILELARVNFPHNCCPIHHFDLLFFISDFKFLELELYLDYVLGTHF